jgi:hypothetical protein
MRLIYNIRNKSKFYCRSNSELLQFKKKQPSKVNLYQFEGITFSLQNTVTKVYRNKRSTERSMNSNFTEIIIVSTIETPLEDLQK